MEKIKGDKEGKFVSYAYVTNKKQQFIIMPTKKNKVAVITVGTFFSNEITDETIETAIKASEIAAYSLGIEGYEIKGKIREILASESKFDIVGAGEIFLTKKVNENKKVIEFGIITNGDYDAYL
ncbi:hypothetical protein [Aneurinibacillus uraniidurans]|uniref:hypothetical protein n=1 Tax=Aneurinibacillus uraniidurans TaxID=2966586 RepID=UPI00234B0C92|nr:hypothetical protein [Aneurinibacillus sp. B1]WCN39632.1 hypothetical protein PO771_09605 [Aneurinibacillus sp. B1]